MARSNTPRQTVQTEPNPELQAQLTDPEQDRAEQHIVEGDEPTAAEERSAEAPGIRTEPEVVADHQADNERAAATAAVGHTADPAVSTSAVKDPRVEDDGSVLFFKRKSDGHVAGVNPGTPEHARLLHDTDFEPSTRAEAVKQDKARS